MELALHLRDTAQIRSFRGVEEHLRLLYGQEPRWVERLPATARRVYVGDEFCPRRLPRVAETESLLKLARAEGWALTLLTPPLTDQALDANTALFDLVADRDPQAEVVVNDWGALLFLRQRYPSLRLAAGRLLNKGFKDPRLPNQGSGSRAAEDHPRSRASEAARALLNRCTFDSAELANRVRALGVGRLERDLLPYAEPTIRKCIGLETSVYFPFGYVTTGPACRLAALGRSRGNKFSLASGCRRLCDRLALTLERPGLSFRVIQGGNSVFYLYPPALMDSFLAWAQRRKIRLVYQGAAIRPA